MCECMCCEISPPIVDMNNVYQLSLRFPKQTKCDFIKFTQGSQWVYCVWLPFTGEELLTRVGVPYSSCLEGAHKCQQGWWLLHGHIDGTFFPVSLPSLHTLSTFTSWDLPNHKQLGWNYTQVAWINGWKHRWGSTSYSIFLYGNVSRQNQMVMNHINRH